MTNQEQPVCENHPDKEADRICEQCKKNFCVQCVGVSADSCVCEDCKILSEGGPGLEKELKEEAVKKKKPNVVIRFLFQNPDTVKWLLISALGFFFIIAAAIIYTISNPHYGEVGIYRVAYYPIQSKKQSISNLLVSKGIRPEWAYLENNLTRDGGFFVYVKNADPSGLSPLWYIKGESTFTINEDSQNLSHGEFPPTMLFSDKGITDKDILNYVYGSKSKSP